MFPYDKASDPTAGSDVSAPRNVEYLKKPIEEK